MNTQENKHLEWLPGADGPVESHRVFPEVANPIRVQRKRTKGWRMPPNTVSVTRPGRWGNYSGDGSHAGYAKAAYRHDIDRGRAGRNRDLTADAARAELRGKNLACFCPLDQPCHADVLLKVANQ